MKAKSRICLAFSAVSCAFLLSASPVLAADPAALALAEGEGAGAVETVLEEQAPEQEVPAKDAEKSTDAPEEEAPAAQSGEEAPSSEDAKSGEEAPSEEQTLTPATGNGWETRTAEDGTKYLVYLVDGEPLKGVQEIDGKSYRFDTVTGAAFIGWYEGEDGTRYYGSDAAEVFGWQKIDGKWYSFDSESGLLNYGWVSDAGGQYYTDPNTGAEVFGWKRFPEGWRYFSYKTGYMATGWQKIDGAWYYLESNGLMATGWKKVDGQWFYLDEYWGSMRTGALYWHGNYYYLDDPWGSMHVGPLDYNGDVYYYDYDGTMHTGWLELDGATYYFYNSGPMARGMVDMGGTRYYFYPTGQQYFPSASVARALNRALNYTSPTQYLLMVDTDACLAWCMQKAGGNWAQGFEWLVSPGKPSTPTVKGVFDIWDKGYSFGWGTGHTCYYYSAFYADYLFHSILYDEGTFNVQDGRLGQQLSHGCVRMNINHAKWIYDNVPYGTTVVIW